MSYTMKKLLAQLSREVETDEENETTIVLNPGEIVVKEKDHYLKEPGLVYGNYYLRRAGVTYKAAFEDIEQERDSLLKFLEDIRIVNPEFADRLSLITTTENILGEEEFDRKWDFEKLTQSAKIVLADEADKRCRVELKKLQSRVEPTK